MALTLVHLILVPILGVALLPGCQTSSRFAIRENSAFVKQLSTSTRDALKSAIVALLPDTLFPPSNAAIKIVSLDRNEVLYELNPRLLFTPASNQKLLTSAAALSILKPEFAFNTVAFLDTLLASRLIIKGFGDPLLTSADLDTLAQTLARILPPGRFWTLAGDASHFDDVPWGKGWMWDDEADPTAMHISPLSVEGNGVRVRVIPGQSGSAPTVILEPPTNFLIVENMARTIADSVREKMVVERLWKERSNTIRVSGEIRQGDSARTTRLSVRYPERYLLTLLAERLRERAIAIHEITLDTLRSSAFEVFRMSHRLDSVVTIMNKTSDNLAAENVLKALGAETSGTPGTSAAGLTAVKTFLAGMAIDTGSVVLADGSGVSRYNLVSADVLMRVLQEMYRHPDIGPVFLQSLPLAGKDGSLENRMRGTAAEGNLRGKTGTLSGVSALSGYVRTADGETLAFVIMMQHHARLARAYRQVQDEIGAVLASWSRNL